MEKLVLILPLILLIMVIIFFYRKTRVKYDVDYFIAKFSAIPVDKWTTQNFNLGNKSCALGFCGMTSFEKITREAKALGKLFGGIDKVWIINDDDSYGNNPKNRILNRLGVLKMSIN